MVNRYVPRLSRREGRRAKRRRNATADRYVPLSSKDEITVSTKLKREIAERIREKARENGVGVNHLVKEIIMESFEPKLGGLYDEEFQRVSSRLGISIESLIKLIDYLIDSEYVYRNEDKIVYKKYVVEPEYVSVDREIDRLKMTPKQRNYIKRQILNNLSHMSADDGLGNGGGV